ncbi:MAG: hypothetical protein QNL12_08905 [Acidimicrobiia bacterium]|nr:hypothetical protein [Acidimicrobiia bacterium]
MGNNGNSQDVGNTQDVDDSVPLEYRPLPPRWWKTAAGRRHARARRYGDWSAKLFGLLLLGIICLLGAWRMNWAHIESVAAIWVAMGFWVMAGRPPQRDGRERALCGPRWLVPVAAMLCAIWVFKLGNPGSGMRVGLIVFIGVVAYWKEDESRTLGALLVVVTGVRVWSAVT